MVLPRQNWTQSTRIDPQGTRRYLVGSTNDDAGSAKMWLLITYLGHHHQIECIARIQSPNTRVMHFV